MIGDLLYTQLLYPGLLDAGIPPERINATLDAVGQAMVDLAVRRIHASLGPTGTAIHLHDPISWMPDHQHPVTLQAILAADTAEQARELLDLGQQVSGGNVRTAVTQDPRATILEEACWQWPFTPTVDYLVWAIAARPVSVR